jgi:hypothetical protein
MENIILTDAFFALLIILIFLLQHIDRLIQIIQQHRRHVLLLVFFQLRNEANLAIFAASFASLQIYRGDAVLPAAKASDRRVFLQSLL